MHVKLTNGVPAIYTIGQLRRDNQNTSFPKFISEATLASYGVYPLTPAERPEADHTKNVLESTPEQINGVWTQAWSIVGASSEEITARLEEKSQSVRSERDYLLQQTDWLVIMSQETGGILPAEWAAYRQALRDITDHADFPYLDEADWPTKPE